MIGIIVGLVHHVQGPPSSHTLVPLLILLSQQMSIIAAKQSSSQLKFIADQFDKCQQTLYQVRSCASQPLLYAAHCSCLLTGQQAN